MLMKYSKQDLRNALGSLKPKGKKLIEKKRWDLDQVYEDIEYIYQYSVMRRGAICVNTNTILLLFPIINKAWLNNEN